ncbi:hypothetical protein ACS0TY_004618 [Phlomoides rotata]
MSAKKTEIKVSINCRKCKTGVMKTAVKFTGVNEVKLDAEKGTLTVIGTADPVCIATKLRKAGYIAEIMSVGPPKKPDEKKPDDEKPPSPSKPLPPCCNQCQLVGVSYVTYDHPSCSIL